MSLLPGEEGIRKLQASQGSHRDLRLAAFTLLTATGKVLSTWEYWEVMGDFQRPQKNRVRIKKSHKKAWTPLKHQPWFRDKKLGGFRSQGCSVCWGVGGDFRETLSALAGVSLCQAWLLCDTWEKEQGQKRKKRQHPRAWEPSVYYPPQSHPLWVKQKVTKSAPNSATMFCHFYLSWSGLDQRDVQVAEG